MKDWHFHMVISLSRARAFFADTKRIFNSNRSTGVANCSLDLLLNSLMVAFFISLLV